MLKGTFKAILIWLIFAENTLMRFNNVWRREYVEKGGSMSKEILRNSAIDARKSRAGRKTYVCTCIPGKFILVKDWEEWSMEKHKERKEEGKS